MNYNDQLQNIQSGYYIIHHTTYIRSKNGYFLLTNGDQSYPIFNFLKMKQTKTILKRDQNKNKDRKRNGNSSTMNFKAL